jgi:putative ABC transport system substrate-binding protein
MRLGTVALLLAIFLTASEVVEAQPGAKVYRIGWMSSSSPPKPSDRNPALDAFLQVLRDHGFVEGQNIVIEHRYSEGREARHAEFAAEFVKMNVDLILAVGSPPAHAAKQATSTIPIVMLAAANPERQGLVASLARPRGNITGVSNQGADASGKIFQVMKEIVPQLSRVAIMWHPDNPASAISFKEEDVPTARALGVSLVSLEVRGPADLERAFVTVKRERPDVLWVHVALLAYRAQILEFAAKNRLPSGAFTHFWPEAGGLLSYGPNIVEMSRRAATYVARILKGAKPGDLPVEQPTKFDLVVNLKAARALGLMIPPSVLVQADRVIE